MTATPAEPSRSSGSSGTELRLAELVAALSLGVDLGFDQPMEHVLRQTVIALRLRPHRQAHTPGDAAERLRREARAGRLDPDAVEAVLAAAGHGTARRHSRPAGLSPREIEVLRLIARGLSSRQLADPLSLSQKTVRNHTGHIYAKTCPVNRVTAGLFAVEHGLLPAE